MNNMPSMRLRASRFLSERYQQRDTTGTSLLLHGPSLWGADRNHRGVADFGISPRFVIRHSSFFTPG